MTRRGSTVLVIISFMVAMAIIPPPSVSTYIMNLHPEDTLRLGRPLKENEVLTWEFETENSSRGLDLIIEDGNGTVFFILENTSSSRGSFTAPKTDWWFTLIHNPSESLVVNATLEFNPSDEHELSPEWEFLISLIPLMAVGVVVLVGALVLRRKGK